MPDVLAGRIIRNIAGPRFKEMDYDGGTLASVAEISRLVTTPGATDELMSKYRNDEGAGDGNFLRLCFQCGFPSAV